MGTSNQAGEQYSEETEALVWLKLPSDEHEGSIAQEELSQVYQQGSDFVNPSLNADGLEDNESASESNVEWGTPEALPAPIPTLSMAALRPHLQEMANLVDRWPQSNPRSRLLCLFRGILAGQITDLRYYTRRYVRLVFNSGYAPGQAEAALSNLKRDLEFIVHYDRHRSRSADSYLKSLDTVIHNGVEEIRGLYGRWGQGDRTIREVHSFVRRSMKNPHSLYYCYGGQGGEYTEPIEFAEYGDEVGLTEEESALRWIQGALGGAATGAATGSVAGPWGALIGAAAGAGLGLATTAAQKEKPPAPRTPPTSVPSQPSPPIATKERPPVTRPVPLPGTAKPTVTAKPVKSRDSSHEILTLVAKLMPLLTQFLSEKSSSETRESYMTSADEPSEDIPSGIAELGEHVVESSEALTEAKVHQRETEPYSCESSLDDGFAAPWEVWDVDESDVRDPIAWSERLGESMEPA